MIPNYCADFERQYLWQQIGTLTSAEVALGVDGRDNASVVELADAKKVIWSPDEGTAAALIRFRLGGDSCTDGDENVIEVYAAKGADYYTRIGTLTTLQGTQNWSSGHFVDEITLSNEQWSHGIRVESVTNEIGRVYMNTGGFDRFLFIMSIKDANTTTVYVDIVRLDKQIPLEAEIFSAIVNVQSATLAMDSAISDLLGSSLDELNTIETILSTQKSAQSDQFVNLETGLRSGIESALSAIDETDSVHSAISGILIDAVDLATLAADSIHSALSGIVIDAVAAVENDVTSVHSVILGGTTTVSTGGGTEKITIPGGANQVAGATQACREVIIYCPSGNVGTTYLQIGALADVNDLPLHEDVWLSIPLNNTNLLNFFGTENDIVYLLWRN